MLNGSTAPVESSPGKIGAIDDRTQTLIVRQVAVKAVAEIAKQSPLPKEAIIDLCNTLEEWMLRT